MDNYQLTRHLMVLLDLPDEAVPQDVAVAVGALYNKHRDLRDALPVPEWAVHREAVEAAEAAVQAQAELDAIKEALGLESGADLNEALAHIRSERQALANAGVFHTELCEALGVSPEAGDACLLEKIKALRDMARGRAVPHQALTKALKIDDEASEHAIMAEIRKLVWNRGRTQIQIQALEKDLRDERSEVAYFRQELAQTLGVSPEAEPDVLLRIVQSAIKNRDGWANLAQKFQTAHHKAQEHIRALSRVLVEDLDEDLQA